MPSTNQAGRRALEECRGLFFFDADGFDFKLSFRRFQKTRKSTSPSRKAVPSARFKRFPLAASCSGHAHIGLPTALTGMYPFLQGVNGSVFSLPNRIEAC